MKTKILPIKDLNKDYKSIQIAANYIREGKLVAFPTETVYGLGANGLDKYACQKIYQAKQRPSDNPLILHVASFSMLKELGKMTPLAEKIIPAFLPGPLTIILEKSAKVPLTVTGGRNTVALRFPNNPIALKLIQEAGVPIAAPSANLSGRPSPTSCTMVKSDLENRIPLILDGGTSAIGVESTIIDCRGEKGVILRPGAITKEQLSKIIALEEHVLEEKKPLAPGMKYRHYAPNAKVLLFKYEEGVKENILRKILALQKEKIGLLISDETKKYLLEKNINLSPIYTITYGTQEDLEKLAQKLYQSLVDFDTQKVTTIIVEGVLEKDLGSAIMNRLQKAAHST